MCVFGAWLETPQTEQRLHVHVGEGIFLQNFIYTVSTNGPEKVRNKAGINKCNTTLHYLLFIFADVHVHTG